MVIPASVGVVNDSTSDSLSDFDVKRVVMGVVPTTQTETVDNVGYDSELSDHYIALPDFSRPFVVRSDASNTGIGAVLLQPQPERDGQLHPVLYASRKLLDRETRYSTVERECLAVVWAVDKFHRYLLGRHFVIETDHKPLSLLKKSELSNSRLLRWSLALQDYQFSVMPISGSVNFEADVLSRLA
jgi:hypothetical protein